MKHFLALLSFGCALNASPAFAVKVQKGAWVESFKTGFSSFICRKGQFFRECFAISEDECLQEALRATKVCLADKEGQIPAALNQPQDGTHWGSVVGSCAGSAFEVTLTARGKKKKSAECADPNKWVPAAKGKN